MTLLRYNGGKVKLAAKILPHMNLKPASVYCEPFCGGASIALKVASLYPRLRIILNDLDWNIYSFWKHLITMSDHDFFKLRDAVLRCQPTIELYNQLKTTSPKDEIDRVFRTLFFYRTSFSASNGKRPRGGKNQSAGGPIAEAWDSVRLSLSLTSTRLLLKGRTTVLNKDFSEVIQPANKTWLIYCDPPYYKAGNSLYNIKWQDADHIRLRDHLRYCYAPWVLSYDLHPRVLALYNTVGEIHEIPVTYSISKRKAVETLIKPLPDFYFRKLSAQPCLQLPYRISHENLAKNYLSLPYVSS